MASMGDMLKLMQGGTDRTGFADMADQYAYTKPDRSAEERLALLKAAMEAGQGGEEGGEEEGGETGGFDFGGALDNIFGDYVPDSIANMSGEDMEKMDELSALGAELKIDAGRGLNKAGTPKVASTGVPKTGTVAFEPKPFGANLLKYFKKSPLGIALMPTEVGAADFPLDDEGMPIYPDEFGMADGGRVGMQQGGAPGGMAMPALLGVSSGSSGNLFSNYMPNPSAVPGPNYGTTAAPNYSTYQAPSLMSLFSPYSGNQFGNIGDSLGGPDPYAVTYDPYVDMGGSAYDQYGMGMTQEDIDKVFADVDKFSLAAQEAKRKAAEEAAAAAAQQQQMGGDGPGPGGNTTGSFQGNYGQGPGATVGGANQGGYGDGTGGACFEPNTLIEMENGSEKKIKDVQLGDFTKGGKVTGVLQFEPIDDIHEYKGVIVAGSHFVREGNEFIMVQDSPKSVKIDKIPVVYSLDTTNRRIFINNIEFADYNGDGIAKKFLNNAGMDLAGFDKEVLRQVEHRLI